MTEGVKPKRRRSRLEVSATLALGVLAAAGGYLGIGTSINLISTNSDTGAVVGAVSYFLVALVGPALVGVYLSRRRGWNGGRAFMVAASLSLAVDILLSPVLVVMSSM
jgi:FtsH-binding integral membrane protein